jgi:SAM-dependent methyltransferase
MSHQQYHESNRKSWNKATKVHNSHKGDQAAFLRDGGNTLFPEEIALLGNIKGLSLLHLQCNAGQDTLSIASHLGAEVTGVDISDEAINFATKLSSESGIAGTFHREDVYNWLDNTDEGQYDIVFASYGAICWLCDLKKWAKGIAKVLKPGGRFILIEFHPLPGIFETDWELKYNYMGGNLLSNEYGVGDYVGASGDGLLPMGNEAKTAATPFENPHPSYEFTWGLSDVVTALLEANLQLTSLKEYPYSNGWQQFPNMIELPGRRMTAPDNMPTLPFMFSVVANKPDNS